MDQTAHLFVIGWARTGTTSLAAALRRLGWKTLGQRTELIGPVLRGDLRRLTALLDGPTACHDWPWPLAAAALAAYFPRARFILTRREAGDWLASYRRLLAAEGRLQHWRMAAARRQIYGGDPRRQTDAALIARVTAHEAAMRQLFADAPQRLLELEVTAGVGWPPLCAFLGCRVPDLPFPHLNRTTDRACVS
jgi:hypothetical protein